MTVHISVLTTLYNHEKFITETINSALQQTLMPNEIVVIDDASSDNSVAVARSIKNPIIRIYSEAANLGGPNTMKGLSLCTGNYVAILNSDDCWEPDKLRQQINYLEAHPECGAAFSHVSLIDENSRPWAAGSNRLQTVFNTHNRTRYAWLSDFFHHGNMLCASSAVIRRSCLSEMQSRGVTHRHARPGTREACSVRNNGLQQQIKHHRTAVAVELDNILTGKTVRSGEE